MAQGETRLLGDKPPGNGLVVVGSSIAGVSGGRSPGLPTPVSQFSMGESDSAATWTWSAAQNSSKTRLQSLVLLQMSLSERLAVPCYDSIAPVRRFWQSGSIDDDASGPWLACAVHNIRVDFAVSLRDAPLPSNRADAPISSHDYFSAASPHRSHPDACPACFCSPSWSSGAWRREELYVAKGSSGRDGVCDRRGSSGFPPAETGWDLYLPNLERARARQGSVLQPCSLSTRTCGRALTFPEVDSSSALTNGPRFKYTLPWQLFCSKRPLRLAESRSCQLDQLLSHRLKAHARNVPPVRPASADPCAGRFLGLEMILKRSTTKSTALAFVRQLFPTHFALILRYHHPHEAAIIFDFGIKNLHRARSLENTAAKDFSLRGLFILRRPPLEVSPPRNNFPKFTTKSTALAFVRQAVPTHSAFIFRGDNKPELLYRWRILPGRFQGDQPVKQNVRLLSHYRKTVRRKWGGHTAHLAVLMLSGVTGVLRQGPGGTHYLYRVLVWR
ncbi:hypothetical protein DFH06DRAFT_1127505 [Mycena polygramma]|nr:hypothetical protein DFH06DRAFT_1127505 [Mycena polygramma]